jgi:hypothetical protein
MRRLVLAAAIFATARLSVVAGGESSSLESADVVVYAGTSAGVVAAIRASDLGLNVLLIEPGRHLGGMTASGLGQTDLGNKNAIGGMAREFYRRIARHYARPEAWRWQEQGTYKAGGGQSTTQPGEDSMWTFEPSVAEAIFNQWIKSSGVTVWLGERLDLNDGVRRVGPKITELRMESGRRASGKVFIDASYEGDVMAEAGVSYHVGRESNSVYGETLNGSQPDMDRLHWHKFFFPLDPHVIRGDPSSGLLPGISPDLPPPTGVGDHRVQAYNFRVCLTAVPRNRRPLPKPAGYDPMRYELLARYIEAGRFDALDLNRPMPNGKTDLNNQGGFSTNHVGANYEYPNGDYTTRERIYRDHVDYVQGLLWFLQNDPRCPPEARAQAAQWGLPKDEFVDNGGWPHQLYIREARRMIGALVMTERHCRRDEVISDGIGCAAYGMDSHNVMRYYRDGWVRNEGNVQVKVAGPYPVSYRAVVPRLEECTNLLVPVCLSASHIAYGSIRMEPVFMVLGESAAVAAAMAVAEGIPVQQVDYSRLRARLLELGQVLDWEPHRATR